MFLSMIVSSSSLVFVVAVVASVEMIDRAEEALRRQAESGDPIALCELGSRKSSGVGIGVQRDDVSAADNYRQAAEAGLAVAQHNLAVLLQVVRRARGRGLVAVGAGVVVVAVRAGALYRACD